MNNISVVLDKPISSVELYGSGEDELIEQAAADKAKAMLEMEMQKVEAENARILQLIAALESAAGEIDNLRRRTVEENRKQIALLAVEIAKKIIASEIEEGKYDIIAMIEKALAAAPSRDSVTVKLSQADHQKVEEILKSGNANFENVKFEADSSILPAQFFVTTSKGVIEYFIEDQLDSIGETLGG